jgi:hypothetical protein
VRTTEEPAPAAEDAWLSALVCRLASVYTVTAVDLAADRVDDVIVAAAATGSRSTGCSRQVQSTILDPHLSKQKARTQAKNKLVLHSCD